MRFRVLGPLEVRCEGVWTGIGAGKPGCLLACLLVRAGRVVPTQTLIFELWGDTPPPTANNLVSVYVGQLRRLIGDKDGEVLAYRRPGYQLRVEPQDVDAGVFEALVGQGRAALAGGDAQRAAAVLAEAEGLWRGGFLADVPGSAVVAVEDERLSELRISATELRLEAQLACGARLGAVAELLGLVGEYPLRERLWLLLMRAMREAGRNAEALAVYARARVVIAEQLGVGPGPQLQAAHAALLAADADCLDAGARDGLHEGDEAGGAPDLAVAATAAQRATARGGDPSAVDIAATQEVRRVLADEASGAGPGGGPAQLPPDIGDFTGRQNQVERLCDALTSPDTCAGPGAVRLAVVVGAGGLGKTTLAVHVAHLIRHHFPDGQLYLNLSGASTEPMTAGDALARFLRALGMKESGIPPDEQERSAILRTRLADRRVLILLDDARDAAQIRSLLPGTASCAVLVTSRNRAPLLAGAGLVDLDTLTPSEALELFARIVADSRPSAEPEASEQVLAACAGLPLAIRICGARLATRRHWRIATMAARLGDQRRRLDELQADDLAVRASFQISYETLNHTTSPGALDLQHAFRLLGLWPGGWISLSAAAALLGACDDDTAQALETLVDVHLMESPAPQRYRFHDLLRLFATERAQAQEPQECRRAAVERVLRWYIEVTSAASDCISPTRYRLPTDPPVTASPLIRSEQDAVIWFDDERANITAAVRHAVAAGLHEPAWRLSTSARPLYNRRCSWTEFLGMQRIAVQAARTAGSRGGEAWALQCLGSTLALAGQPEALARLEEALVIRRETGDTLGQAQTAVSISDAYRQLQGPEAAYDHSVRLLDLLREVNDPALLAHGLNGLGVVCHELGRREEAAAYYQEALRTALPSNTYIRAYFLGNLGQIHLDSGRLDEAIAALTESHAVHTASGNLVGQALALRYLAKSHGASGRHDEARHALLSALELYESLKAEAEADAVRTELAELARPDAPEDIGTP